MLRRLSRVLPHGKRVLVRVDFNVPIARGRVEDDFRIRAALPTIRRLIGGGNRVVLLSHHSAGGQTIAAVAARLRELLKQPVTFIRNPASYRPRRTYGRVTLLENLRLWRGEEASSPRFAKTLTQWGDVFVNDAFSVSHRRGASLTVLPRLMPSFLGLRFEYEMRLLDRVLKRPQRPLIAVLGGAKIETKLAILQRFNRIADLVLVGGAMANTLIRGGGVLVGRSLSRRPTATVRRLARSPKLLLPVDAVVVGRRGVRNVPIAGIRLDERALDIGPSTRALFRRSIRPGRTIVWNGPLGLIEEPIFSAGTLAVARSLARHRGFVIVGGGDTIAFIERFGLRKRFKHVSTGGGAMLAYIAGEKLPALEALKMKIAKGTQGTKGTKERE